MKVNPIGLKKVIQKSSFNYRLEGSSILFETDTITSRMISPDNTYAVILNCPNDVITAIEAKKGVELNFDLKNKPFSKRVFHQFNTDECTAKLEGDEFIIADDADMTATFAMTNLDHIVIKDALTEFTSNIETSISLDKEFIHHALGLCRSATKAKVSEIQFIVEKDKPYLKFKNEENSEAGLQLSGSITGKIDHDVSMSFRRKDLKEVLKLVKSEKQKQYQIKFIYDDSKKSGCASVESNDGTEQYVLYSKRDENNDQLISFEQRYDITPEVPMEWSYTDSVEKVKANVYKWKNLGEEIFNELWIAREILSKSKSEAAKIMHGTIVPWMTWTQYCEDIGSSRQVVNRWLKRAFGNIEDPDAEPKLIEQMLEMEVVILFSPDPETGLSNDLYEIYPEGCWKRQG